MKPRPILKAAVITSSCLLVGCYLVHASRQSKPRPTMPGSKMGPVDMYSGTTTQPATRRTMMSGSKSKNHDLDGQNILFPDAPTTQPGTITLTPEQTRTLFSGSKSFILTPPIPTTAPAKEDSVLYNEGHADFGVVEIPATQPGQRRMFRGTKSGMIWTEDTLKPTTQPQR